MTALEQLLDYEHRNVSQKEISVFFNSLEAAPKEMMYGKWKGSELNTGHYMEGNLTICRWHGKEFKDDEHVHPLVFSNADGSTYCGNPALLPITLLPKIPSKKLIFLIFQLVKPLIKTKKHTARLRMVEYHGKVSAAMIYDKVSIIDIFRKVDENTLLGIMDIKNSGTPKKYYFVLRREG